MNDFKFIYEEDLNDKSKSPLLGGLDISHFFNILYQPYLNKELISEIDKIYDFSQNVITFKKYLGTINKESWLKYRTKNNITISGITEYIGVPTTKNNNKPLFENTTIPNDKDTLMLRKEGTCKSEYEYLYNVLNCLFQSNRKYYIKKCIRCNKYFLSSIPNKRMCNRERVVCGKTTTCVNALNIFYKSKEYKIITRKIERHLKPFYNKYDYTYINDIREKFNVIKQQCIKNIDITKEDIAKVDNLINDK